MDRLKEKGNEFFKNKHYKDAVQCYTESLDCFESAAVYSLTIFFYSSQ